MFELSLLSAAKEERPESSFPSTIFGKTGQNSPNLAEMIFHNSVKEIGFIDSTDSSFVGTLVLSISRIAFGFVCPKTNERQTWQTASYESETHNTYLHFL